MHRLITAAIILGFLAAGAPLFGDIFYTPSQYRELYNKKVAVELELEALYKNKVALEEELASLKEQYGNDKANMEKEIRSLQRTIQDLENKIALLQKERREDQEQAKREIDDLKNTIELLKQKSSKRDKSLLARLKTQREDCAKRISRLKEKMKKEREMCMADIDGLKKAHDKEMEKCSDRNRRLRNELAKLKHLTEQQQKELSRMENQTRELEKQLEKEIRLGQIRLKKFHDKLIINIDDKISFDSGSAKLKKGIRPALKKIAAILERYPENKIMVEGHTDNVPIHTAKFRDNWELSTARALAVLRYVLKRGKSLDEKRFAAVGYSKYHPIVPNNSRKNKALNRRVDIVVVPRVKSLKKK